LLRDVEQLLQLENLMSGLNQQFQALQRQELSACQSLQIIQEYRQQSEQALLQLDNSFKNVFFNLEKDLEGYYNSLSYSLEKLNILGQEGETKLIEYLHHLAKDQDILPEYWCLGLEIYPQEIGAVLIRVEQFSCQEFPLFWLENGNIKCHYTLSQESSLEKQLIQALQEEANSQVLGKEELQTALNQVTRLVVNRPQGGENQELWLAEVLRRTHRNSPIDFQEIALAAWLGLGEQLPAAESSCSLVLYGGSNFMQLALIHCQDFTFTNLAYGVEQLEQDIFCQLIYPQWQREFAPSLPNLTNLIPPVGLGESALRQKLLGTLENHPLGISLLQVAQLTRLILQQQNLVSTYLKEKPWQVRRSDLENQILTPLLAQLEGEVQNLLRQRQLSSADLAQVVVTGPFAENFPLLRDWLADKFPGSSIYCPPFSPGVSQIARGLARSALAQVPK
jgi:hypothetical protein